MTQRMKYIGPNRLLKGETALVAELPWMWPPGSVWATFDNMKKGFYAYDGALLWRTDFEPVEPEDAS